MRAERKRTAAKRPARKRAVAKHAPPGRPGRGASRRAAAKVAAPRTRRFPWPDPAKLTNARPATHPSVLSPQLAELHTETPTRGRWFYEVKFDGYRILAVIAAGTVALRTRRGNDWSAKMRAIAEALTRARLPDAILDGEVVVLRKDGVSDFQALQNALGRVDAKLAYFLFDVPFYRGYDLRKTPLEERQQLLSALFATGRLPAPQLRLSEHVEGDGRAIYANACRIGLEGVIAKDPRSPYESRRASSWQKVKCVRRQEFVIGGYTRPGGSRTAFGALLVGYHDARGLRYGGRVGTGFDTRTLTELLARMRPLERATPPFYDPPRGRLGREAHWIEPRLVCEVSFLELTAGGRVRASSFKGLREDKSPNEIGLETEPRASTQDSARK